MRCGQVNQQDKNIDTIYGLNVLNAQCFTCCEKYSDAGTNCDYALNGIFQAYAENVSCFRHLATDIGLQR